MTDTTLPGLVVRGQRRTPSGAYPVPVGPSDGQFPQQNTDEPPPIETEAPPDPCADPSTATDWNVDAAAAIALEEFKRLGRVEDGNSDGFPSRERHAYIYQRADGSIYFGPLTTGDMNGVNPNTDGMTPGEIIGAVHNHPGGTPTPSGADWTGFDVIHDYIEDFAGAERASQYRLYVIAYDPVTGELGLRVYDETHSRDSSDEGLRVNPEGQPCPGVTIAPPSAPS